MRQCYYSYSFKVLVSSVNILDFMHCTFSCSLLITANVEIFVFNLKSKNLTLFKQGM